MRLLQRIRRDKKGSVTVMFAGGLSMLITISALAIDTASFYNDKRRLQAAADAAALAAAANPQVARSAAIAALTANNGRQEELSELTLGVFRPDPSMARASRFTAGVVPSSANAVRVKLERPAATIFARALGADRFITVNATATAARIDLASFSLGSRLASVSGGLPNAILSGLAGTELGLSVADYNSLLSANVDVLKFLEALKVNLDLDVATFNDVLDADLTLPQVAQALATATTSSAAAAVLRNVASRLPTRDVPLSGVIDVGPLGTAVKADVHRPVTVDVASALKTVLEVASPTRQVSANVGLDIPGLTSSTLTLQIGDRVQHSPWVAVSNAGNVTVRTAQTRLLLDVSLSTPGPLSLGQLHLPLYVELASATAQLADVSCRNGRDAATAGLNVTPTTGKIALGTVNTAQLNDFSRALDVQAARIASVPAITVTGRSLANLSSAQAVREQFNAAEIRNHTVHTTTAGLSSQALLGSLIQNTSINVSVVGLGLGLNNSLVSSSVLAALGLVTSPVDQLLATVMAVSGTKIGQADSWVNGVRCGTPILVA